MTTEEKPFDTSRIPVFYQDGSVKVGDKEYAPGEYPLGTDTMADVDEVRIDTSSKAIADHLDRFENDPQAAHHWVVNRVLFAALAAERDELERLAGDLRTKADALAERAHFAATNLHDRLSMEDHASICNAAFDVEQSSKALSAYQRKQKEEGNG